MAFSTLERCLSDKPALRVRKPSEWSRGRLTLFFVVLILPVGCRAERHQEKAPPAQAPVASQTPTGSPTVQPTKEGPLEFIDVTQAAGITFKHNNGASGKKYWPEKFGSGCAFLDYDNDGWQDILLVNSMDLAPSPRRQQTFLSLYHNRQDGTFTDVTAITGLARPVYGIGVAVADYDNDGWKDIFITALGHSVLYRNLEGARFEDVTTKVRLTSTPSFPTGAVWFDYDKDGKLDLFVSSYGEWSADKDVFCSNDGVTKTYCTAGSYRGSASRLYRNLGPLFEEVTHVSRLDTEGKSVGAAVADYDRDGWPDILVANDGEPNRLYHNNGRGQFTETAEVAQIAISQDGKTRAARGVDAADYDRSGYLSFAIAHAFGEMTGLFHNEGKVSGLFVEEAATSLPRPASRASSFSALFFDYDLDGWPDLLISQGSMMGEPTITQSLQLLHNAGKKRFEDVSRNVGKALRKPMDTRGVAYGDYDRDGDLDLLISTNGGPAYLIRNEHGNQNHFLNLRTIGTTSNRDGIGTKIAVFLPDGTRLWNHVRSSSGYCSQSSVELTFGLGQVDRVAHVEIEWPSGKVDRLNNLAADQFYTIKEGSGILR